MNQKATVEGIYKAALSTTIGEFGATAGFIAGGMVAGELLSDNPGLGGLAGLGIAYGRNVSRWSNAGQAFAKNIGSEYVNFATMGTNFRPEQFADAEMARKILNK